MTALLTLLAGLLLAAAGWRIGASALERAGQVALVAVLGVTAATFNVIVPIPSIEATTTVVLCTAAVLGVRMGIGVGLVAVVASSVAGGIGSWTIWQVVAVTLVAVIGAALLHRRGDVDWYSRPSRTSIALAAVVATLCWDVVVTAGSAGSYATQAGLSWSEQVVSALLVGVAFTLVHVAFTTLFTLEGGPPLLHALQRARPRLAGGVVTDAPAAGARSRSSPPTPRSA